MDALLRRQCAVRVSWSKQIRPLQHDSRFHERRHGERFTRLPHRRGINTQRNVSSTSLDRLQLPASAPQTQPKHRRGPSVGSVAPLSCLPLSNLIRSYIITTVSSVPILLRPSLNVLTFMAHGKSPVFSPDKNPLIRFILKKTFYAQFCAGKDASEINTAVTALKAMGYSGVILGYAKEAGAETRPVSSPHLSADQERLNLDAISCWERGTLDTVDLSEPGGFVALKFSGAGPQTVQNLSMHRPFPAAFEKAVDRIFQRARERGVKVLIDAEQVALQRPGNDNWVMHFMNKYNRNKDGGALVYNTYQAYLKGTPETLADHLKEARDRGFTLGVKLVRGAYLATDPRHLICDTFEDTSWQYNGIAEAVMRRRWNDVLTGQGEMPEVNFVLASHNRESIIKARQVRDEQVRTGEQRIEMVYAQLQGMADNIGCELVQAAREIRQAGVEPKRDIPRAFKCLTWGTVGECTKFLLRRAQENHDAVARTAEVRQALGMELWRRTGFTRFNPTLP